MKWTDPTGHWTFSLGFTFRAGLIAGGSYSVGITLDTSGNVARFDTYSHPALSSNDKNLNYTLGAYAGGSLSVGVTSADTIDETAGASFNEGIDASIGHN